VLDTQGIESCWPGFEFFSTSATKGDVVESDSKFIEHVALKSYDDVAAHADAIGTRLRDGTMPCDEVWPQAQVELFQRWIDTITSPTLDGLPRRFPR
jgi:hypothetical protein